jgi:RecJ-like exonuclease
MKLKSKSRLAVVSILIGVAGLALAQGAPARFVGVNKCKFCHSSDKKGNQYNRWKSSKHAAAYDTLAGEPARQIAAKLGIANAQESPKCLQCHATAAGVSPDLLDPKFDPKSGAQCESCHGPGEAHIKARMAGMSGANPDVPQQVPAGEIVAKPTPKLCESCHNQESPTYKPFNFDRDFKLIAHPDPRRK